MTPSRFLLMMASADDSTMAARGKGDAQLFALAALLALHALRFGGAGLGGAAGGLLPEEAAGVLLGLAAVGEVAGDFQEAADRAGVVAQGGDDDAGPEARAVLAH